MKITKTVASLALISLLLINCGGSSSGSDSDNPNLDNLDDIIKDTEPDSSDDRSLAQKIIFNKSYKDTVSKDDHVDWFLLETAKADHEYYFHLKNRGDRNENPAQTYVQYAILDDDNELKKGQLSTVVGENTYAFTTKNSGNLYIKFDSRYSLGDFSSSFEFDVKTGLEDGMVQDNTTFEYNNFKKVSYLVEKNKTYTSTATGTSDSDDWYLFENIDSAKEQYLHLINLGDPDENPSMNNIQCEIIDEKGKIMDIDLPTTVKEKSYAFTPVQDGKVYLHFYTNHFGAVYGDMDYSFDLK